MTQRNTDTAQLYADVADLGYVAVNQSRDTYKMFKRNLLHVPSLTEDVTEIFSQIFLTFQQ